MEVKGLSGLFFLTRIFHFELNCYLKFSGVLIIFCALRKRSTITFCLSIGTYVQHESVLGNLVICAVALIGVAYLTRLLVFDFLLHLSFP